MLFYLLTVAFNFSESSFSWKEDKNNGDIITLIKFGPISKLLGPGTSPNKHESIYRQDKEQKKRSDCKRFYNPISFMYTRMYFLGSTLFYRVGGRAKFQCSHNSREITLVSITSNFFPSGSI